MKKLLVTLLLVCMVLPMTAHAAPSEPVEGYFTYVPRNDCEERLANDNLIWRDCTDYGDYYEGSFLGESEEVYDFLMHGFLGFDSQNLPMYERGRYKGTVTFNGTVLGRGGREDDTMVIMFVGKSPGDIFTWSGTWRIIGGTGELANVHGQGVWGNAEDPTKGVHYEGQIHFNP
jgi:hypothetical protein